MGVCSRQPLADGKGVHREVESEGSRRQTSAHPLFFQGFFMGGPDQLLISISTFIRPVQSKLSSIWEVKYTHQAFSLAGSKLWGVRWFIAQGGMGKLRCF
jgi:hypothetical protein